MINTTDNASEKNKVNKRLSSKLKLEKDSLKTISELEVNKEKKAEDAPSSTVTKTSCKHLKVNKEGACRTCNHPVP